MDVLFIHYSYVDGHLGCFQFELLVNEGAVNIVVYPDIILKSVFHSPFFFLLSLFSKIQSTSCHRYRITWS